MPGFDNDVLFMGGGIDTRGTTPISNQMNTNGQLLIGSTAAPYIRVATLTAGSGIGITNGAGSITISATGGGFSWMTQSSSMPLSAGNGFIANGGGALAFSLPATSAVGDQVAVTLDGATSWSITQGAGQQIRFGNLQTASGAGGSLTSTAQGDSVYLVCSVADTKWNVIDSIGNITIA
jgi:hypothetical protein